MMTSKAVLRKVKISVGVVFYNPSKEEVRQTLYNIKQLRSINLYDFSFYLIDNASPKQKLLPLLPKILEEDIHYKLLKNNNGFGAGHNSILNAINSDFHIIMNPDIDVKDLTGFIRAIKFMYFHHDVVMLSPLIRNKSDGNIQYLNRKEPTIFDLFIRFLGPHFFSKRQAEFVKRRYGYDHIQLDENATGSFMIIRTTTFKNVKGFDTRFFMYFEDTDLTKRLLQKGKVLFYPYFTVVHGWKRENHSLKGLKPMLISMVTYFNKWGWRFY